MTKSYEELLADMTEIIAKVYEKGYDKGYEQGKFDAESRSLEGRAEKRKEGFAKTRQTKRDRIVEQAKADVVALKNKRGHYEVGFKVCNAEFVVNKDKRTVVCLLRGYETNNVLFRGIAKAYLNDCFNVHIGKAIALRRALGLEVPDEYLNAPQPTEVRVGDVIRMKYYNPYGYRPDSYYVKIINVFDGDKVRYEGGGFDFRESVDRDAKIIDDSREEERDKEVSE